MIFSATKFVAHKILFGFQEHQIVSFLFSSFTLALCDRHFAKIGPYEVSKLWAKRLENEIVVE